MLFLTVQIGTEALNILRLLIPSMHLLSLMTLTFKIKIVYSVWNIFEVSGAGEENVEFA